MGLVRLGQKEGDFTDFENGLMRKQLFALKGTGLRSSNYCHAEVTAELINLTQEATVDGIIYLVGLIVIIMAILSFLGLH